MVPEKTEHSGVIATNMRASDDEIGILRGAAEWCRRWSQDLISLSLRPDLRKAAWAIADNVSDFERRAAALEQGNPDPGEARRKRAVEVHHPTRGSGKASPPRVMGIAAVCPTVPKRQDIVAWWRFGDLTPEELRAFDACQRQDEQAVVRAAQKTCTSAALARAIFATTLHAAATLCAAAKETRRNVLANCSGRQGGAATRWRNVSG